MADNDVGNTSTDGVSLSDSSGNRIERNRGDDNDGSLVHVRGSSSANVIEGNRGRDYEEAGIIVGSGTPTDNRVESNDLATVDPFDADADGIYVSSSASRTVLRSNTTHENPDDGIDVDSPSTTLRDNRADDNGDLGIEAVAGVRDGVGTRPAGTGTRRSAPGSSAPEAPAATSDAVGRLENPTGGRCASAVLRQRPRRSGSSTVRARRTPAHSRCAAATRNGNRSRRRHSRASDSSALGPFRADPDATGARRAQPSPG